eukprot:14158709-Alexandrium_andersonii.AAC.1
MNPRIQESKSSKLREATNQTVPDSPVRAALRLFYPIRFYSILFQSILFGYSEDLEIDESIAVQDSPVRSGLLRFWGHRLVHRSENRPFEQTSRLIHEVRASSVLRPWPPSRWRPP